MHAILQAERALVDPPPHNLSPLPAQANEDVVGVHPASAAITVPFEYGAAIATPGGDGHAPGQGLDLPAQILGLGLPRGGSGNNRG